MRNGFHGEPKARANSPSSVGDGRSPADAFPKDDLEAGPGVGFDAEASIDDQLCFALYVANNAMMRAYRPLLAAVGLTYPQYLVMLILWEERRSTSGRLARRLDLAPNALTPLLDRLEAKGLIARRRDDDDRRRVHVEPTAHADTLREAAARTRRTIAAHTGMNAAAITTLRDELRGLVRRMADADPRE